MKLTKTFWVSLVVLIVVFTIPTILTYHALAYDGNTLYGFPLTFYTSCVPQISGGGSCSTFSLLNLIVDLVILIGLPLLLNYLILKFKK